jgi:hypothetical protein
MTSQLIRRFVIAGVMPDWNLAQSLDTFKHTIEDMMRVEGYVPVLDIDPVYIRTWLKDDYYNFQYIWQGVHVGKDDAWLIEGISAGKKIPIPKTK